MVSRRNINYKAQQDAKRVPHYGIRKLSIGVASVLLGTVFYMQNSTVHADVNPTVSTGNDSVNVVNKDSGTSNSSVASRTSTGVSSANSVGSMVSTDDATNLTVSSQSSVFPAESVTKQVNNAVLLASEPESMSSAIQVNMSTDNSNVISSLPPASHHQAVPASNSNEIVNEANQGSVDQNNNKASAYISNDQQNSFGLNNNVNLNSIVRLNQSAAQRNRDASNLATNQILSNLKMTLDDADHASSFDWYVGQNDFHTYDINMSFDISANNIVAGRRYSVVTVYAPYVYNTRSLPLWISGGYSFPFVIKGTQYGTFYLSNEHLDGPDHNRLAISLSISKSADKKLLGLQHFSLNIPHALQFGYAASPQMFKSGQTQIDDPLLVLDANGDELSRINLKIHLPSATYRSLSPFYWDYDSWGAGSASGVRIVHRVLLPFNNNDDLMAAMQGKGPVPRSSYPDIIELGGHLSSSASDINFNNDLVTLNLSLWVYHSDGRLSNELIDLDRHGVSFKSLNLGDSLAIDQMSSRTFNGFGYSRQSDGSYLYLIKIPSSDFVLSDAELKAALLDRSWQIAADSDPQKALQVTLDRFHDGVQLWNVFTITNFLDPSISTVLTNTRLWNNFMSSQNTNQSIYYTTTPIKSGVQGYSTVKLHVVNSENGAELQQVRSFTDWPNQNKHASLSIPSITGYELVSNPQSVLSALHLSGTAISSSVQVDYPAENTVADYYVVLQPKTESANVQIVDVDESNKVLATGTVSGRFGEQIVSSADIQSKLDSLMKTGHYTLASNGFDSGTDYKDGTNTVMISLKHKLDSVQRHYRVIEDLPDGTKKVIIDMEATLYKDAARSDWQDYGAYTVDGKLLKTNDVKLLKQTNILDNPGSAMDWVNANIDSVLGYRHYIDRKSYPHYGDYYGGLGIWGDDSTIWMDLFKRADPHDGFGFATSVFPSTDFHILYTPKDEVATVNIVDADENNKVLSTGTVTGKFNTQIVTNDDVQAKLRSLLDTGHYVLQSNGFDQAAKYQDGTNTITIALKHKIDSTQRHYRVIEDLPDGTKKVVVDYQITFYKDAASKYYNRMGAVTVDTLKLLKPNSVQMSVGQYSFPNDNTSVYSAIDEVPGYSYQMIDGINSYDNGVNCRILTDSQMAPLPPTTFNKTDFKDLVFFDLFLGGSNDGGTDLVSNLQNIGCVENPLASRDFHIEYSRNSYPVTVNYYNIDSKLVDSVTSMHKFGDTVSIAPVAPTNYVLASGQAKTDYLMRSGLNEVDFLVEPKLTTTAETKMVSRTIKVQTPDGRMNDVVQTVTFVRNSYFNQVTKQTTYSPWSFGGQYQFSGYLPKQMAGYTADVISAVIVTPDSLDTTVSVVYHKIPVVYSVDYRLSNGTVVKNVSATPERDGTIHLTAPQGYRLLTTVTDVQVDHSSQKLTVLVLPDEQTYTAYSTLPSSVTEPLTKTITRTINITMPNGRVRRIVQQVHFVRTATVVANGKITYSNWTGVGQTSFDRLFVPKRRGYRLVMADKQGQTVTGVNQMVVDPSMDNVVINVKYVK